MAVDIQASYTKKNRQYNGLEAIEKDLIDPQGCHETYTVVARVVVTKIQTDVTDGSITPKVRLTHIEPLGGDRAKTALEWMHEQFTERTGGQVGTSLFDIAAEDDADAEEAPAKDGTSGTLAAFVSPELPVETEGPAAVWEGDADAAPVPGDLTVKRSSRKRRAE